VLDFVQYCVLFQARDEASNIGPGGSERCGIVEGVLAIASTFANLEGESSLPTLSRPVDEDDWRVRERSDEGGFRQSTI
jgi:hypothetical protein